MDDTDHDERTRVSDMDFFVLLFTRQSLVKNVQTMIVTKSVTYVNNYVHKSQLTGHILGITNNCFTPNKKKKRISRLNVDLAFEKSKTRNSRLQ